MAKVASKNQRLRRRRYAIRNRVKGTTDRPRLSVHRSLKHISAQIIDDSTGKTLAAASSVKLDVNGSNVEGAKAVGKALGEAAKAASIEKVAFDRNGRLFHGRVKALAEAARESGLDF